MAAPMWMEPELEPEPLPHGIVPGCDLWWYQVRWCQLLVLPPGYPGEEWTLLNRVRRGALQFFFCFQLPHTPAPEG
ncbi:MAG: hypothetical protein ABR516_01395 [Desulfuromonadaceae bacterium]